MTIKTKYQPRIEKIERVWTPEAKLWTPHNSKEITFASPAFGPNNYLNIGQEILSKNLKVPIGDYTASLLHSAYCTDISKEKEFKDVKGIMNNNWLWIFNIDDWTDKGVYVILDKKAVGRSQQLDINKLEKRLKGGKELSWGGIRFSKDKQIRFAPKESYFLGEHTSEELAKDGVIIASCDEEGAEKLGEVSTKFRNKPYVHGLDIKDGQKPELRVSAVDDGDGVGLLRFGGDDWGGYYGGHAFGGF